MLVLSGSPPLSLAARHGRALLGGGYPSPFPPSSAARIRRAQLFGGGPLLRLSVRPFPLLALSTGGFAPPLLPLWPTLSCGPMAILGRRRPRSVLASHRCRRCLFTLLTTLARVAFGCVFSCDGGVCGQVPCAASSLRRRHLHVLLHRCALSRRAVAAIGRLLPGVLDSGWFFVPSPLPPSVLPPSGLGRCGGSQGFVSPGSPIFSGGRVIP